ncbi:esterase/lipase family protein [Vibrio coralliilyticus]|uniref:esterase/lipase family protein n=1 Tax=Vibrio coralliilyticus TaxID=190893 RepID=UPI00218A3551|nr:triacylglycerol lipase [Vibrio sp. SCSIO 43186]USD47085.1 triacylglycerol lipase [Vibrio sp. SCSIO 43145]USD71141.1 triacylglycerol lipase [Vibrio sp. SCSIO 43139]
MILAALCIFSLGLSATTSASSASGYTQTQHPIVLVHGLFGFDTLAGVDYFYGIPHALTKDGASVYVAQVSATNSSEVRGEQLLEQVETLLAATGAAKVNLIGHSHGGPTARYVASVRPDLIASVTSIGGVNKGSKVADLVRGTVPEGSGLEALAVKLAEGLTTLINLLSGGSDLDQDPLASLDALTTEGSLAFNQHYPEGIPDTECGNGDLLADNGVYYYSWTGSSTFSNIFDPTDAAMMILGLAFDEPNDGLVGACSTHLGQVIRDDYKMNHLDEINGLLGIHHLFETDPVTLYRQHANRLKLQGL